MNNSTITGIIIALIIGGGAGYFMGNATTANGADSKKLQESVVMMKDQSSHIQEMAQLMQSDGTLLQDMGMKYNDTDAVSKGKDLQSIGAKYMKANTDATAGSNTMGKIMQ